MLRRSIPIIEAFHRFKAKLSRIAAYGLICLFFVYGTLSCYTYFMIRQQNSSSDINTFCKDNPQVSYCQFPEEKRFSKFLLFATDCWPVSYADDVLDHYKEHSVSYFVNIPGAKYSHAIYTSYFTGQLPTNYKGDPIKGDHLIRSMLRSAENYKFQYIGPEWSFLAIFGKDNYDTFFVDVNIQKEALDVNFQHPYPFFFENNWNYMNTYLTELAQSGASMFAHTGVFDHRQHGEHRGLGAGGLEWPRTDRMARVMQSDMKSLKDWIDNNPEYLLILLSDHGVDQYGMGGYTMHGESEEGNEPFILLYNPKLPSKQEVKIDIVDVASTLAFYLRGAEIPMNSMGIAQTYFGDNTTSLSVQVLQQNLRQLSLAAIGKGVAIDTKLLDELLSIPHETATHEDYEKILEFAQLVKGTLYNVMDAPWMQVMFYTAVSSVVVLFILIQYNEGLDRFVFSSDYFGFFGELCNILLSYGLMFLQLLFCWWNWRFSHNSGDAYRLMSPGLALLIVHQVRKASKLLKTSTAENLIYRNEVINLFVVFFATSLPDVIPFFDQTIPFLGELMAVLAILSIFAYYKRFEPNRKKIEPWLFVATIVAGEFYRYTEEQPWYFVRHFHVATSFIYLTAIFSFVYFVLSKRISSCIVSINVLMFLLYKDAPSSRMFLILLNYQFLCYVLPLLEQLRMEVSYYSFTSRDPIAIQPASVAHQAAIVYAINQIFFAFTFSFGDKINFDIHPFAGRIGIDGYDVYPVLSAFMMSFHKYGIFSIFCIFGWQLVTLRTQPSGDPSIPSKYHANVNVSHWLSDLLTAALMLFFSMTNLGTYIMFWVATRYHPLEEGTAFVLLLGVIGAIYCTLHIIHAYQTEQPTKSFRLPEGKAEDHSV